MWHTKADKPNRHHSSSIHPPNTYLTLPGWVLCWVTLIIITVLVWFGCSGFASVDETVPHNTKRTKLGQYYIGTHRARLVWCVKCMKAKQGKLNTRGEYWSEKRGGSAAYCVCRTKWRARTLTRASHLIIDSAHTEKHKNQKRLCWAEAGKRTAHIFLRLDLALVMRMCEDVRMIHPLYPRVGRLFSEPSLFLRSNCFSFYDAPKINMYIHLYRYIWYLYIYFEMIRLCAGNIKTKSWLSYGLPSVLI